eukprot:1179023-Prorocentrum_minimum.AAC.4
MLKPLLAPCTAHNWKYVLGTIRVHGSFERQSVPMDAHLICFCHDRMLEQRFVQIAAKMTGAQTNANKPSALRTLRESVPERAEDMTETGRFW